MFYRIGDAIAVSLDPTSVISRIAYQTDPQQVVVTLSSGTSLTLLEASEDFGAYTHFLATCPSLASELQRQELHHLAAAHAHPETEELPRTLFTLFASLPGSDDMELHLSRTGAGAIWTKEPDPRLVLTFRDFEEGVTRLLKRTTTVPA